MFLTLLVGVITGIFSTESTNIYAQIMASSGPNRPRTRGNEDEDLKQTVDTTDRTAEIHVRGGKAVSMCENAEFDLKNMMNFM